MPPFLGTKTYDLVPEKASAIHYFLCSIDRTFERSADVNEIRNAPIQNRTTYIMPHIRKSMIEFTSTKYVPSKHIPVTKTAIMMVGI